MPEMNNFKSGNNIYEVADSKARGVPLTWAQYQALSYEEQHNGTAYYITDMDAIYPVDHELNANSRNAVANDIVTPHILAMENVLGAHNLLPYPYVDTTRTIGGNVSVTDNADGTLVFDGSNTSGDWAFFQLFNGTLKDVFPKAGKYTITTNLKSSEYPTLRLRFVINNVEVISMYDTNNTDITITDEMLRQPMYIDFAVTNGGTTSSYLAKPMICPYGTDPTYVKHTMTNEQLMNKKITGVIETVNLFFVDGTKAYTCINFDIWGITRAAHYIISYCGQCGISLMIPIAFIGNGGFGRIEGILIPQEAVELGWLTSGNTLKIPNSNHGNWGSVSVVNLIPAENVRYTVTYEN